MENGIRSCCLWQQWLYTCPVSGWSNCEFGKGSLVDEIPEREKNTVHICIYIYIMWFLAENPDPKNWNWSILPILLDKLSKWQACGKTTPHLWVAQQIPTQHCCAATTFENYIIMVSLSLCYANRDMNMNWLNSTHYQKSLATNLPCLGGKVFHCV